MWIEPKMSAKGFTCHSSRGKLYFNKRKNDFGVLGGGQMVSVLVCYDAPSLNPAEVKRFSLNFVFEKNGNKQ